MASTDKVLHVENFPAAVLTAAKVAAAQREVSLREFVIDALKTSAASADVLSRKGKRAK